MNNRTYGLIAKSPQDNTNQERSPSFCRRLSSGHQRKTSNPERRFTDHRPSERRVSISQQKVGPRSKSSDRWLLEYKGIKSCMRNSNKIMSSTNLDCQKPGTVSPANGKVMLSVSQSLSNTGSDIVKQGYLYVKRPPGNKWNKFKAWHKRYFVLKESGDERGPELVMFSNQQEFRARNEKGQQGPPSPTSSTNSSSRKTSPSPPPTSPPSLSMFVQETVHIGITSESHRFQHVLVVVFSGRAPLLLAAEDELTARMWMQALDLTSSRDNNGSKSHHRSNPWSVSTSPATRKGSSVKLGPVNGVDINVDDEDCGYINHPDVSNNNNTNGYSSATICGSLGSEGSGCSCVPAFIRESSTPDSPLGSSGTGTGGTETSGTGTCEKGHSNLSIHSTTPSPIPDFFDEKINVGKVVERFPVYFIPTEDSERIGLRGPLQLVIYSVTIGIARKGDKECFILWPINVIRQYRLDSYQCSKTCSKSTSKNLPGSSKKSKDHTKSSSSNTSRSFYRSKSSTSSSSSKSSSNSSGNKKLTLVTIEVGRRCSTGEGIYKFTTEFGEDIIREIKKTVNNLAAQNSSNTFEKDGHFRRRTHSSGAKHSPPVGRTSENARRCLSSMAEFPDPFRPRTLSGSTLKPAAAGLTTARAVALARLRANQAKTSILVTSSLLSKSRPSSASRLAEQSDRSDEKLNNGSKVSVSGNDEKKEKEKCTSVSKQDERLVTKSSSDVSSLVYSQPFFIQSQEDISFPSLPRVDESTKIQIADSRIATGKGSGAGEESIDRIGVDTGKEVAKVLNKNRPESNSMKCTRNSDVRHDQMCGDYVNDSSDTKKVDRKTIKEPQQIDTFEELQRKAKISGSAINRANVTETFDTKTKGSVKEEKSVCNGHVEEDDPYLEIIAES